jgi:hypothetical protein
VVFYLGYSYYNGTFAFSDINIFHKISNDLKSDFNQKSQKYLEKGKNLVEEEKKNVSSKINSFIKEKGSEISYSIGEDVVSLGENLKNLSYFRDLNKNNESNNSSSEKNNQFLSTTTVSYLSYATASIPFSFVIDKNTELKISLKPSLEYYVEWGDGKFSQAKDEKSISHIISHKWEKEGDYEVKIILKEENTTTSYFFYVRVLK